ncbi:T9SS type A sorting domain-containing protein [candidate division TA06 bacterium]|uniref:T9SS type A sorting domain-containing protein n=1 Tax=candidate division TA06 bacterium TaxID=2250710 RepID=A0A933MKS0_UNCT6|nr:T9SS type A sorting domain-containing protein [candidate division TA06 bacterium]
MKRLIVALCLTGLVAGVAEAVKVRGTEIDWATAGTETRKLGRFAGSDDISLVYTDVSVGNQVFSVGTTDGGASWSSRSLISNGEYPCLSVIWTEALPRYDWWTNYTGHWDGGVYLYGARSYAAAPLPGAWAKTQLAADYSSSWYIPGVGTASYSPEFSPPAMMRDSDGRIHLVRKTLGVTHVPGTNGATWDWAIRYAKFDSDWNLLADEVIAEESCGGTDMSAPSVCLDFNFVPHAAWSQGDKVWYSSREGGAWSAPIDLSRDTGPIAGSGFVDFFGDRVHAVWEAILAETGKYEVWRSSKILGYSWSPYYLVSNTSDQDSRWPQIRGTHISWSENLSGTNWEIMLDGANISNNTTQSKYGQMEFWQDATGGHVALAWTDQWSGLPSPVWSHEIQFSKQDFSATAAIVVEAGQEEPSPYNLQRDGYLVLTGSVWYIDYDYDELIYRLPYLKPEMRYKVRLIGRHGGTTEWRQMASIDGTAKRLMKVKAGQAETVEMWVPEDAYATDKEIIISIKKMSGDYANCAGLELYEYEREAETKSGGSQTAGNAECRGQKAEFRMEQNAPNPFSQSTAISYQLTANGHVSLKVYNIAGQLVKTLVNRIQGAGAYSAEWDGKDDGGREASAGVYMYRLTTGEGSLSKRLIMVR